MKAEKRGRPRAARPGAGRGGAGPAARVQVRATVLHQASCLSPVSGTWPCLTFSGVSPAALPPSPRPCVLGPPTRQVSGGRGAGADPDRWADRGASRLPGVRLVPRKAVVSFSLDQGPTEPQVTPLESEKMSRERSECAGASLCRCPDEGRVCGAGPWGPQPLAVPSWARWSLSLLACAGASRRPAGRRRRRRSPGWKSAPATCSAPSKRVQIPEGW